MGGISKMTQKTLLSVSPTSGQVAIEVYNPTGAVQEVTNIHAERPADLAGKTVGELSNGWWEANRTFPLIRELLQKQVPRVKIIPYTALPFGSRLMDVEDIGDIVKGKGCQAVIVGNSA
jgi:hypothetical protein